MRGRSSRSIAGLVCRVADTPGPRCTWSPEWRKLGSVRMRRPDHSRIVVAVPTKKREAFVVESGAFVGWILVSLASGRVVGTDGLSLVGGPEEEGLSVRCFMVAEVVLAEVLRLSALEMYEAKMKELCA